MGSRTIDLDHVGVGVRDLDIAAKTYERLGFTLSPFARHAGAVEPGGPVVARATANRCAMLKGGYIEIIAVVDLNLPSGGLDRRIAAREGIHIVAFGCEDPIATNAALVTDGFQARGTVYLERMVDTPEGPRLAKFERVPVAPAEMPEAVIFHIKHLTRDVIWQLPLLRHANRAVGLDEVWIHADDLDRAAARFRRFLDLEPKSEAGARVFALPRGRCVLLDSAGFARRGVSQPLPSAPSVVGIVVGTASADGTADYLRGANIGFERRDGRLHVSAADACGVALAFAAV
jgi:catechol 2,3-dioxygenase-like lactoylglutathione lyase family enzyme